MACRKCGHSEPVYLLRIIDVHGGNYAVHGYEDQLYPVYKEWRDTSPAQPWQEGVADEPDDSRHRVVIRGIVDDWDHSSAEICLTRSEIRHMAISRER